MNSKVDNAQICSFCHTVVGQFDKVVACPTCKSPYHSACWTENQDRCAVLGCTGEMQPKIIYAGANLMAILFGMGLCVFAGLLLGGTVVITRALFPPVPTLVSPRPYAIPTVDLQATVEILTQQTLQAYASSNADLTAISKNNDLTTEMAIAAESRSITTTQAAATNNATTATIAAALTYAAQPTSLGIDSTKVAEKDGMILHYVPAGEFLMGSNASDAFTICKKYHSDCDPNAFVDEAPPHIVYLDSFWVDQTEITTAMYAKCVNANVCQAPRDKTSYTGGEYYGNARFKNYPVINVSWNMAKTYCEWAGRRLPTEAEWEKAARSADGRIYPWGNTLDSAAVNFCDVNCPKSWALNSFNDGYSDMAPVGSYPAGQSPYGAYDMAGNAIEWVNDWYSETYYQISPASNPLGPNTGTERIRRGGAWFSYDYRIRASYRSGYDPSDSFNDTGFRCVHLP